MKHETRNMKQLISYMLHATCLMLIATCYMLHASFVLAEANNKYGIHLAQPNTEDIKKAAELVNSNGGKWGYVTLVIQENDRDVSKWQSIFDQLRENHLIPIIRLATNPEGPVWRKPNPEDAEGWAHFLNALNWVVQNRYIILFNEPNHAAEWGGSVDPEGYAQIAKTFAQKLKESSGDYVLMIAGLDASAPSAYPNYADEAEYLQRVVNHIGVKTFNELFSGLSSHSYPNPAFAGSPAGSGKGSVRTYQWELSYLEGMGVKELPVFITETGWDATRVNRSQIANNYQYVFQNIWNADDRVVAVTPFVLSFLTAPFSNFSWLDTDSNPYPEFNTVQNLPKLVGNPKQRDEGNIQDSLPSQMTVRSSYHFRLHLKNTGQAIWDVADGYTLSASESPLLNIAFSNIREIRPKSDGFVDMIVNTGIATSTQVITITLKKDDHTVLGKNWELTTIPLPPLTVRASFYPKLHAEASDVEIQVFNSSEEVVYKDHVQIHNGIGKLRAVPNIAIGEKYRIVMLRPHYLPRQKYLVFQKDKNTVGFSIMLPLDFNSDGTFDLNDISTLLGDLKLISLWIPSSK